MKETRKATIKSKVFSKKDIDLIAKFLMNERTICMQENTYQQLNFIIICDDDTVYESDSMSIFEDGNIFDLKRIDSIELTFNGFGDFSVNNSIHFKVSAGNHGYNYISVSGSDSNWVRGTFARLKDIIDSVEPQNHWLLEYRRLVRHITAVGIGKMFLPIYLLIISAFSAPPDNPSDTVLLIRNFLDQNQALAYMLNRWVIPWMVGLVPADYTMSWLLQHWKNIEFNFGPKHYDMMKIRRNKIIALAGCVGSPIIVSIIYDFMKGVF